MEIEEILLKRPTWRWFFSLSAYLYCKRIWLGRPSNLHFCISLSAITALSGDIRADIFRATLPSVVRFAQAFPPLIDECIMYLLQLGRIVHSQVALGRANRLPQTIHIEGTSSYNSIIETEKLFEEVKSTFIEITESVVVASKVY